MIPKFTSEQDKLSFLKLLPQSANYRNMLRSDFGFLAPSDASQKNMEQFWKFLVAFNRDPKDQNEVEQFYSDLMYVKPVVQKERKHKYVAQNKNGGFKPGMTGVPSIKEEDGMFYGYLDDVMVVRSRNKKYLLKCFKMKGFQV